MRSRVPKLLHPLCGRPLVDYVVETAQQVPSRAVVAVVGAGARAVRARLPRGWRAVTQSARRGTGHAVALGLRRLPRSAQQVLVLYGDQPLVTAATLQALLAAHRQRRAACTILTALLDEPGAYGRVVRHGDLVVRIVEALDASADERAIRDINVGAAVCERRALEQALQHMATDNAKREYYFTDAITWLAGEPSWGPVLAHQTADAAEALGVNTRADLARAARLVWQRTAEQLMERGVTIVDPATTYIAADARIGQDTTVFPCTVIERDVVIGRRCAIGPFARLRAGVRLADDVRIGNFAEVVRARIGPRVRMNHGSYLGDATVDADVNIGAGAITANYDGRAKHHTRIGARAFIGSGTVIVAPAAVGPRAVTGAGCVVTRGTRVQPGRVVVGVPARELTKTRQRRSDHER